MTAQIEVIKRDTIPPIRTVEEGGQIHYLGELRDFRWSEPLRAFMQDASRFSASWVELGYREVLKPHTHPVLSLMVFYRGAGELIGDLRRSIGKDDVVVVPPGHLHGFVGGPPGLYALSIQFSAGLYTKPEEPRVVFSSSDHSLTSLVAASERRATELTRRPMFRLLADGSLASERKRAAFLAGLRLWTDRVRTMSLARTVTCDDPKYVPAPPSVHLAGGGPPSSRPDSWRTIPEVRDPTLDALTGWFSYQMFVLDNVEKAAVVHLAVEGFNAVCRRHVARVLGTKLSDAYFGAEDEAGRNATDVARLLGHETPATYSRLERIVAEAWDMAEAISDRIADITRAGAS
jgi:mannose-6-phosphate isomerase-like protein (cupin superfamily)